MPMEQYLFWHVFSIYIFCFWLWWCANSAGGGDFVGIIGCAGLSVVMFGVNAMLGVDIVLGASTRMQQLSGVGCAGTSTRCMSTYMCQCNIVLALAIYWYLSDHFQLNLALK